MKKCFYLRGKRTFYYPTLKCFLGSTPCDPTSSYGAFGQSSVPTSFPKYWIRPHQGSAFRPRNQEVVKSSFGRWRAVAYGLLVREMPALFGKVSQHWRADLEEVTIKIAACISDLRQRMALNFLKLKDDKTDIMLFGSVKQLEKFPLRDVPIGTAVIMPADKVRNLGVMLDPHLTMSTHVTRIFSEAYYHLRDIGRIRPFLTVDTTERVVHAFVTSRLDMDNALFYGITQGQLQRLQRIQNSAARLVTRIGRRHHIKPVLQ